MAFGYPVMLEVAGRRCVVIGDGAVREGKVEGLLAAGADDVLVVATGPARHLEELASLEGVTVERRSWRPIDMNGAFLVVASSVDAGERAAVAREARARRALVNVIDDIPNCDYAAPAIVRRGELLLAIGTGGASPALARKLRERFQTEFGPEWSEVLTVLHEVREETLPLLPNLRVRAERWRRALDADEAATLVREGRADELRARLRARLVPEEARR
jgi:siroheme synthase-like protein